jgi:hypothetical protein
LLRRNDCRTDYIRFVYLRWSRLNREHYDYNRKHEDPAIIVANVGNITGISLLVGSTAAALGYSFKREFLDRRNQ